MWDIWTVSAILCTSLDFVPVDVLSSLSSTGQHLFLEAWNGHQAAQNSIDRWINIQGPVTLKFGMLNVSLRGSEGGAHCGIYMKFVMKVL